MSRNTILLIEDDAAARTEIARLLSENNYHPIVPQNCVPSIPEITALAPDLILLDLNLPGTHGRTLLKNLRRTSNIPVIILTSQNSETNEVLTISYGADDFIAKPFSPDVLLLRIGAVLKRAKPNYHPIQTFHHLTFDNAKGTLANLPLTKTELLIFSHMLARREQIVTRQELMTLLWNNSSFLNDNTLTVNISRLRDKLAKLGLTDAIETRKGIGYILR